jgi:hypothetical protein
MRFLPTHVHGVLDYVGGLLLMAAPWIFGFASDGVETSVPIAMGALVLLYSLLTRYELGVIPTIPMVGHLWMDGLGGAFLAASPWVFGFADIVWWPHMAIGLFEVIAALTTKTVPSTDLLRGPEPPVRPDPPVHRPV